MVNTTPKEMETHDKIIQISRELFMEHGYRSVSTRMIAQACNLSQPALYHHFKDKQTLYTEVLKNYLKTSQIEIQKIINNNKNFDSCIHEIVYWIITTHPTNLSVMGHDIRHELTAEQQKEIEHYFFHTYPASVANLIENHLENINGDKKFALRAAYLLLSMADRFGLREPNKEEATTFIVQIFLHGLVNRK